MTDNYSNGFDKKIGERLKRIMEHLGLEVKGFAALIERSTDHVYSLLNGRRKLTKETAELLSKRIGNISAVDIFRLNHPIKDNVGDSPEMEAFRKHYANNKEFFSETKEERKLSFFVRNSLVNEGFFGSPKRVADVVLKCKELGQKHSSEKITKTLKYLVFLGILKSKKKPIILKNGKPGKRLVNVYWEG